VEQQFCRLQCARQGRSAARQPLRPRCNGSPTRPPPPRPVHGARRRTPFSNPLSQLWAVKGRTDSAQASVQELRADGHLSWADSLEQHYRTGKTVGRGEPGRPRPDSQCGSCAYDARSPEVTLYWSGYG